MKTRLALMLLGFAAAFAGDWFLVIRRCGVKEPGFLMMGVRAHDINYVI